VNVNPQDPQAGQAQEARLGPAPGATEQGQPQQEAITQPAKLLRIASMVRELLEETRQASIDEPGRVRLREIYQRSFEELREVLSPDLQEELAMLAPPMEGVPTEAEIRVAQAQLVGWLEGLFHGIQAALFAQQAAARAQFEELRRRGLPTGQPQPPGAQPGPGQYL
jgi:proteasome activator-like protein